MGGGTPAVNLPIKQSFVDNIDNANIAVQHARVYTLGKRGQIAHFKVSKSSLEQQGIDIHNAGRGGETTFHGPGQIVLYPVVNLRRLGLGARAYVEALEDCMVDACGQYGIHAKVRSGLRFRHSICMFCMPEVLCMMFQGRAPGRTGVWVDDRKIGAIGVKISSGVAWHGIAINVNTDLSYFNNIVPCGIANCEVTSVSKEVSDDVNVEDFGHELVQQLHKKLKYDNVVSISSSELFATGAMASTCAV